MSPIPTGAEEKPKVKELKDEIYKLKLERDAAQAALAQMKASNLLELEKAKLEKEIEMRKLIDDSYDKGYERCKQNLKDARALMSTV